MALPQPNLQSGLPSAICVDAYSPERDRDFRLASQKLRWLLRPQRRRFCRRCAQALTSEPIWASHRPPHDLLTRLRHDTAKGIRGGAGTDLSEIIEYFHSLHGAMAAIMASNWLIGLPAPRRDAAISAYISAASLSKLNT